MAGKLHTNYASYIGVSAYSTQAHPYSRRARAYAEGYQAKRNGALQTANPAPAWQNGDASSDYTAWNQGWLDANAHFDPTHVGGPTA